MDFPLIDWGLILTNFMHLGVAYLLALPIAWDREKANRSMGLRTFPLVAIASCGFIMLGISALGGAPESQARIIQGLMTGIGFIGGGAILKEGGSVRGTATAASVWSTGAIGAATAYQRYEIAVMLSLITFATLHWLTPLKEEVAGKDEGRRAGRAGGEG